MKKIRLFYLIIFLISITKVNAEIIILSSCDSKTDGFLKNEYTLDLNQFIMTRVYVYNDKTYKKYRITDLSIKKENQVERLIYKEEDKILTEKLGYPQFYTQLVFEFDNPTIKVKTVINKIEKFEKES